MSILLCAVKALRSSYQKGVVDLPVADLYPWTFYTDERWRSLVKDIEENGMIYPLLIIRLSGVEWYELTKFGRKPWKLPFLEESHGLPDKNAKEVLAVRVGCQRFHIAVDGNYDTVSCLVFDSVTEALRAWGHIRAKAK